MAPALGWLQPGSFIFPILVTYRGVPAMPFHDGCLLLIIGFAPFTFFFFGCQIPPPQYGRPSCANSHAVVALGPDEIVPRPSRGIWRPSHASSGGPAPARSSRPLPLEFPRPFFWLGIPSARARESVRFLSGVAPRPSLFVRPSCRRYSGFVHCVLSELQTSHFPAHIMCEPDQGHPLSLSMSSS